MMHVVGVFMEMNRRVENMVSSIEELSAKEVDDEFHLSGENCNTPLCYFFIGPICIIDCSQLDPKLYLTTRVSWHVHIYWCQRETQNLDLWAYQHFNHWVLRRYMIGDMNYYVVSLN